MTMPRSHLRHGTWDSERAPHATSLDPLARRRVITALLAGLPARTAFGARIIERLRELPADATIDDAIEKLVFVAKIERGIAELEGGHGVPHDEVKRRFDELVAAGLIRPPQEQGDPFEDWPDVRLPRGTAKRLIDEDRGDD